MHFLVHQQAFWRVMRKNPVAVTAWQWPSMHDVKTLILKQPSGISVILLFAPLLLSLWHVKMPSTKLDQYPGSLAWLTGTAMTRSHHSLSVPFLLRRAKKNQQRKKLQAIKSCQLSFNIIWHTFVSAQGSVHLLINELSSLMLHLSRGGRQLPSLPSSRW